MKPENTAEPALEYQCSSSMIWKPAYRVSKIICHQAIMVFPLLTFLETIRSYAMDSRASPLAA